MAHYVTRSEFARKVGLNPSTVTRLVRGKLKSAFVRNRIDMDARAVKNYLTERMERAERAAVDTDPAPELGTDVQSPLKAPVDLEDVSCDDVTSASEAPEVQRPEKTVHDKKIRINDVIERDMVEIAVNAIGEKLNRFCTDRASALALELCRMLGGIETMGQIEAAIRIHDRRIVEDIIDTIENELSTL